MKNRITATAALAVLAVAGLVTATAGAVPPAADSARTTPLTRPVTWAAIGDSFSSGEGISGAGDAAWDVCARSDLAYGVRAAQLLRSQRDWEITSAPNAACTGAVTPEVYEAGNPPKSVPAQLEQIRGTAERFDVITVSTGGNDIGFADTLADCIVPKGHMPDSWTELANFDVARQYCTKGVAEMFDDVDALLEDHQVPNGSGGARDSVSLSELYRDIVENQLTSEGILVVAGYPRIFAPVDEWPAWRGRSCEFMTKTGADRINQAAGHLDDVTREAIDASGVSQRIVYVSRLELFDNDGGSHSLCGQPTTEWLNGITFIRRFMASFHPNEPGHAATAEATATAVEQALGSRLAKPSPTTEPEPEMPPTTVKPIATGDRYELGDDFSARCTVAWPTAPTRSAQGITMRTTCPSVNKQFLFVDIFYGDPDLDVTPSHPTMDVEGQIVDIGESEMGFKVLMVEADDVTVR